jgi:hypothetical protein
MLVISQTVMEALEARARVPLATRIDDWLVKVRHEWAAAPEAIRRTALLRMLADGHAAGMVCERDAALFACVCVMLGSGWRERLSEPRVSAVLSDPGYQAAAKLLWLEDALQL